MIKYSSQISKEIFDMLENKPLVDIVEGKKGEMLFMFDDVKYNRVIGLALSNGEYSLENFDRVEENKDGK